MALTNADNPAADKAPTTSQAAPKSEKSKSAEKPALLSTGGSSNPDVQFLASRRAHLVGALATGPANPALADEIEAIDATLAELGYRA